MNQQRRLSYMKAMGIPVWAAQSSSVYEKYLSIETISRVTRGESSQTSSAANIIESLGDVLPQPVQVEPKLVPVEVKNDSSTVNVIIENLEWSEVQTTVNLCKRCDIHQFRTQAIFGSGSKTASWMIIGESPDVEEDSKGSPFLGKAGHLLDNILLAVGLNRDSVYLTNIIKCRPPNDRDPHVDEITNCMGYLQRQIELIEPKVILVVGRVAMQQLLQTKESISRMRGRIHHLNKSNIPVIVTYHPRYLLRQASEKRKVWQDIKLAKSVVQP